MSAAEVLVPLADPASWRAALAGVPHGFAHTWESCNAMAATSCCETWLYRYRGEDGVAVCPLAVRAAGLGGLGGLGPDVTTPYGFSGFAGAGRCAELPRRWAAFARQRGWACGFIAQHPLLAVPAPWDPAEVRPRDELHVLDLRRGPEALFAALSENRRREVRRGLPEPVLDRGALVAFFRGRRRAFFAERGAAPVYELADETVELLFASGQALPLGAAVDGRLVAVALFAWTPWVGEYLFCVSEPAGRRFSAALVWEGALRLAALGVPWLNLGGGVRPGDGVAGFKERFGARRVPFVCLQQVYEPHAYERACRSAGVDPADRSGYFPPYRATVARAVAAVR